MANKVILTGNLGKDPEVRQVGESGKVATFSIATTERYKDKQGELVKKTEWHNIVMWNKLAELAEKYLKKGNKIYLEGKLTHRSYEAKDGSTKYITEIVGKEMEFLGGDKKESQQPAQAAQSKKVEEPVAPDDDLPF